MSKGKYECHLTAILRQQGRMKKWLCEQTGINPGWLTKLVAGESLPNVHHAIAIADSLGVDVRDIWPLHKTEDDK